VTVFAGMLHRRLPLLELPVCGRVAACSGDAASPAIDPATSSMPPWVTWLVCHLNLVLCDVDTSLTLKVSMRSGRSGLRDVSTLGTCQNPGFVAASVHQTTRRYRGQRSQRSQRLRGGLKA
jgi:hypothetical protein